MHRKVEKNIKETKKMDKRTRRVIEQMLASETEKNTISYEIFVQIPAKRNSSML